MTMRALVRIATFAAASLLISSAHASDKADVMATVNQFNDGLNKGDTKAAFAACADQGTIIDDFSPHVWQGANVCANWANALDVYNKKVDITDSIVKIGEPWHVTITADRAYVVAPVRLTYKQKGKPVTEAGSVLTVALQKLAAGWRITGFAWAQH